MTKEGESTSNTEFIEGMRNRFLSPPDERRTQKLASLFPPKCFGSDHQDAAVT